ncbi:MAG: tetratricopeptide repeat protein [Acidobacteria bacterium]|nr:tetratricopeptide repeat protein [Acidobacteriota bacterium]
MTDTRRRLLVMLALAAACLLLYGPTIRYDFVNFDDPYYVTANPHVNAGLTAGGIHWAFATIDYDYWQPLSWLSLMLDCQVFGLHPAGHHAVNVVIHAVNAMLAFAVLLALTGAFWRSAAAAAIFALHPLRLESVAWIAERKDLLGGFFFLATLWCYLRYVKQPSRARYRLVLLAFALGLMSKPVGLTLPALLLLLDWWPLGRRAFAEKVPLFAMAAASAFITMLGTWRMGSANWGAAIPLGKRIANLLVSYVRYLELSAWPHDLAVLYPFRLNVPLWQASLAALLLAGITGAALWQARRRPLLIVGWLWFALVLLPAGGIAQKGRQGMADRFTYLPHIGLAISVVWGAAELLGRHRRIAAAAIVAAPCALAAATAYNLPVWRDSVTLFSRTVAVTGDNPVAQHFLAIALESRGRYLEALPHHAEAVRLEPSYFIAQYAYGVALERQGRLSEAVDHFRAALRWFPDYPDARAHLEADEKLLDLSKASGSKLKTER